VLIDLKEAINVIHGVMWATPISAYINHMLPRISITPSGVEIPKIE
jgi:hypothetical protein